ncbi:hypothetical protein HOT57_gp43 [Pseudomonas phage phCDa]|uniref:Uncharacterized protein n=1 Tax=Pseudomonas phage phCDa TaxID=2268587 RepID=A0A2Z5H9V1_9CAUD|nr:hypothetical protein HOT57_gp43 [Pseudomonas phage phCDa]AXC36487.1 hypothetical protein phCDa_43 [Pseudomonas phage phCDa]
MSTKRVGWCRLTEELVLDVQILNIPYLRDDMDVYVCDENRWLCWAPEHQAYNVIDPTLVPDVIKMAMVMLE